MKGLLLKDWYVTLKNCKLHLGIIVLMAALSLFRSVGPYYLIYVMLFAGMIPVYTLSVDEKWEWNSYAQTLPYTRKDVVTAKYIYALLILGGTACALQLLWCGRAIFTGGSLGEAMDMITITLAFGLVFSTVTLPFMFRLGVEKGRLVMMIIVALLIGVILVVGMASDDTTDRVVLLSGWARQGAIFALLGMLVLFFLSWLLAVRLYEKREL